jgi:hypothetical protein
VHTGEGWTATLSLRGLCAPVVLPVSITDARTLPSSSGGPPTHELSLTLHAPTAHERDALATLRLWKPAAEIRIAGRN